MKRLIVTLALGAAAYGVTKLYKAIAPCNAAAKEWDKEFSQVPFACPGMITFKFRRYSLHIEDESFELIESILIPDEDPDWVRDGLDEISIEAHNPTHVSEQAKFAAKFSMSRYKLSDKADKEIRILGIAYFEQYNRFTYKQRELIKKALISRLNSTK